MKCRLRPFLFSVADTTRKRFWNIILNLSVSLHYKSEYKRIKRDFVNDKFRQKERENCRVITKASKFKIRSNFNNSNNKLPLELADTFVWMADVF